MGTKVDYTGKRFGMLTIIGKSNKRTSSGQAMWEAVCDCGSKRDYKIQKSRPLKSCGCDRIRSVKNAIEKDMSGLRQGMLKILKKTNNIDPCGRALWLCTCDCGSETLSTRNAIVNGKESCGCIRAGRSIDAILTHGMSNISVYKRWEQIIQRCNNRRSPGYKNYGGRGISICEEWLDFKSFYADMGDIPWGGATIDRIDNNGNYNKGNCEWADMSTQGTNQRSINKHGWKGVDKYRNKYRYRLVMKDELYTEAGFDTAKDAGLAYLEKKKEIYNR